MATQRSIDGESIVVRGFAMNDRSVSFCRALEHWGMERGSLAKALAGFRDHRITSEAEVHAVCRALDTLHSNDDWLTAGDDRPLATLAHFLTGGADNGTRQTVIEEALPILRWYVTDALTGKPYEAYDLMKVLQVLAIYRQKDDVALIYKAVLQPIAPNDSAWFDILATFRDGHPYLKPFLQALAKHPPPGRSCLAFLGLCNHVAGSKQLQPHVFNYPAGMEKLRSYLNPRSNRPLEFARAAIDSAKLLEQSNREELLASAMVHPDPSIPFRARVIRASLGDPLEIDALVEACRDVNRSYETQQSLREIGLEHLIPQEATADEFLALAKAAHWLVTNSPLQCAPDRLKLLDSRDLFWLPRHQHVRLYAVKYEFDSPQGEQAIRDGIALVGSITHSLIGETNSSMDLVDVYGLHCCWELESLKDPMAPRNRTIQTGRNLLRKHNPHL